MDYDYGVVSTWTVIKRFLLGWTISFIALLVFSIVKHWDFITAAFINNMWALFNAAMPCVIIVLALLYMIRGTLR